MPIIGSNVLSHDHVFASLPDYVCWTSEMALIWGWLRAWCGLYPL